jgi:hypothetical protein
LQKTTHTLFIMATTTATITINSADLTGDSLALSQTATLTTAGFLTGLTQTTGVGRKTTFSTSQNTLFASASYTANTANKIYIKNTSSLATEHITLSVGAQDVGRLYAGDWAFLPWDAGADFRYTPSVNTSMTVEYMLIFE